MTGSQPQAAKADLIRVHQSAARFFRIRLADSWVPAYLAGRGFGPAVQERWQAGYAPAAWDDLTRYLRAAGYADPLIEAAGLARRSRRGTLIDTFRDRVMLPIRAAGGIIVAFIGRAPDHAGPGVPKYLNSTGTSLYSKSEMLFGLSEGHRALADGAQPVIVEGPFDAIAVTTAGSGRFAGTAPCGAVLTAGQAAALGRAAGLSTAGVLVAFDPDQAGRRATVSAYRLLAPLTAKSSAVILPPGTDPAQILREHGPAALAWTLAMRTRPLIDVVIDAEVGRWSQWLRHPEGQVSALRAAAPLVAALPPAEVARQVARLARHLELDHAIVTEAITDALPEVVAAGATARMIGAAERGPRDVPAEAVRAASRDSPGGTRQPISQLAPAPCEQVRRLVAQPALRARHVPG